MALKPGDTHFQPINFTPHLRELSVSARTETTPVYIWERRMFFFRSEEDGNQVLWPDFSGKL